MITAVNICGIPHKVQYVDDVFGCNSQLGLIEYAKAEISINKNMSSHMMRETLCHEIVHGILVHLGYNDLSDDEHFVQAFGNALNQTFEIKNIGCDCNADK